MKQYILNFMLVLSIVIFGNSLFSQTTTGNNTAGAPSYLGWNSTTGIPLIIQNKGAFGINFELGFDNKFTIGPKGQFFIPTSASSSTSEFFRVNTDDTFVRSLNIERDNAITQSVKVGISVEVFNSGATQKGIFIDAQGIGAIAPNANNFAVLANCAGSTTGWTRTVWGLVPTGCNNGSELAAHFDGDLFTTQIPMGPSDVNLKQNILEVNGEDLEKLNAIVPKTYYYDPSVEVMNLPTELQYGVIAQNVDSIFPSFTRIINHPPDFDEEGNIVHESIDYLAVAYPHFIALLVAGWQDQQAVLTSQENQLSTLRNQLNELESQVLAKSNSSKLQKSESVSKYSIYPNPAENMLNAHIELKEKQNTTLVLYDLNMKKVETLIPATQLEGSVNYQFDLSNYPIGFYFVVLETGKERFVLKLKH
jgi:hypothetical protein